MTMLFSAQALYKHFDGVAALSDFSCGVAEGEVLVLLGPNGAGKTTFFNVVSGLVKADSGIIRLRETRLERMSTTEVARCGIGRTFQEVRLIRGMSVLDNVMLRFPENLGEHPGHLLLKPWACHRREKELADRAQYLLESVGLLDRAPAKAQDLSYGQQKLLSIASCLATGADLILLDEPVAGVSPGMMERVLAVIDAVSRSGTALIVIEHDIDAVKEIAQRVIFMDAGVRICEGTPAAVLGDPRVIEAYLD